MTGYRRPLTRAQAVLMEVLNDGQMHTKSELIEVINAATGKASDRSVRDMVFAINNKLPDSQRVLSTRGRTKETCYIRVKLGPPW